jgi:hypothetical protein
MVEPSHNQHLKSENPSWLSGVETSGVETSGAETSGLETEMRFIHTFGQFL